MQEETKIQGKLKYLFSKRDESIPLAADPTITIHTSGLQNRAIIIGLSVGDVLFD